MRVPDEVLKSVVFIGSTVRHGGTEEFVYGGTGFLLGRASEHVEGLNFIYLVTARHVITDLEGDCWIRTNLTDGTAIRQDASHVRWIRHPSNPLIDVAVAPFYLEKREDHIVIPPTMVVPNRAALAAHSLGVGDEVFYTGVFARVEGKHRNMPILRKGNIAMLPEDQIFVKNFGDMDAYLVETHSISGISGSPVFVRETVAVPATLRNEQSYILTAGGYYLMGLMHGHWEIDPNDVNAVKWRAAKGDEESAHLGISLVVPAAQILETLDHPDLVNQRRMYEEQRLSEQPSPVPDSARQLVERISGPEPERLAIEGSWEDAVKKAFSKGKPPKDVS